MSLVLFGDLHLSHTIYSDLPNMVGDSEYALQQVGKLCAVKGAAAVTLGDTFNCRYPEAALVNAFIKEFTNVELGYIVAQHDWQSRCQWAELGSGIKHNLHEKLVTLGGIKVYGLNHMSSDELKVKLPLVPPCDILCLHQIEKKCLPYEADDGSTAWDFDSDWVPEHVKAIVIADWHGLPNSGKNCNGTPWMYTGSSSMRSASEPLDKRVLFASLTPTGMSIESIPIKTRPFLRYDLLTADDLNRFCSTIISEIETQFNLATSSGVPNHVAVPIVYVSFFTDVTAAAIRIKETLSNCIIEGKVYLKLAPKHPDIEEKITLSGSKIDTASAISALIDSQSNPEAHALAVALATNNEHKEILAAFRQKFDIVSNY